MKFDDWNAFLGEAFLRTAPRLPVYFAVTESELQRQADKFGLGLHDPVEDLRNELQLNSYFGFQWRHRKWWESKSLELPPWLPWLAATTLVVDKQLRTSRPSKFYEPLTEFIKKPDRVTEDAYRDTFGWWWRSMAAWVVEQRLGLPTWESIPASGPRSVIGHPYTQVLLRPDELRQLEVFLSEFDRPDEEFPTAADRVAVANQLVNSLLRWARNGGTISSRLRKILESGARNDVESLGYLLLGRLFDDSSGAKRESGFSRYVRLVPAFDEYERRLKVVALAPTWAHRSQPIVVPHADGPLDGPGDAVVVDLPMTDALLRKGLQIEGSPEFRLLGGPRHFLAARQWDLWCGVESALPDEDVYVLMEDAFARRFDLPRVGRCSALPPGWALCGPVALEEFSKELADGRTDRGRRLIPKLRGGLRIQRGLYLRGGEPTLELAGLKEDLSLDGQVLHANGPTVVLSDLDLPAGRHVVRTGGFELTFDTIESLEPVDVVPSLGRDDAGSVVPTDSATAVVTGARTFPDHQRSAHRGLIPFSRGFVKFGDPGQFVLILEPTMARWARDSGLCQYALEIYARSNHPEGQRGINLPCWVAWQGTDGSWMLFEPAAEGRGDPAHGSPDEWTALCARIGPRPIVWGVGQRDQEGVLERWQRYCSMEPSG